MSHLWLALLELGRFLIASPWRTIAIILIILILLFMLAYSKAMRRFWR